MNPAAALVMPLAFALPVAVSAGYALEFPESGGGSASSSIFYPVNCRMYAADIAGHRVGLWRTDAKHPDALISVGGAEWGGSIRGNEATVWLYASGRAKAKFRNGRLVRFERGYGGETDKARDQAMLTQDIPRNIRTKTIRRKADHTKDGRLYWAKSGRLRLWYGNPNATGTLFAQTLLLGLAGALYLRRRQLRVAGAVLAAASAVALAMTGSRGGTVAAAAGVAALLIPSVAGIKRIRVRLAIVAACVVALALSAMLSPTVAGWWARRDESSATRLQIWRDAPRMMTTAPEGWRTPTGYAWCDWFQPLDSNFSTAWMVNSHLSWLAQYGTHFRFAYIFGWTLLLLYFAAGAANGRRSQAFAFSQWTALAVALWFNTVGFEPMLWAIPVASLTASLAIAWHSASLARLAVCAASAAIIAFCALRTAVSHGEADRLSARPECQIEASAAGVKIGHGRPRNFLVHDNSALTGGHSGILGKDLREFYVRHPDAPATLVVNSPKNLPGDVDTLVLAGKTADSYLAKCRKEGTLPAPRPRRLVLLSPVSPWNEIPDFVIKEADTRYIIGEFAAATQIYESAPAPRWVDIVPASATYIRDWTERSLK